MSQTSFYEGASSHPPLVEEGGKQAQEALSAPLPGGVGRWGGGETSGQKSCQGSEEKVLTANSHFRPIFKTSLKYTFFWGEINFPTLPQQQEGSDAQT